MAVPEFAWYFRIRMGWGTGRSPTRVPCCRNLRISDSSVRPLEKKVGPPACLWRTLRRVLPITSTPSLGRPLFRTTSPPSFQTHLSIQIFSTWGTNTCSRRMMVCRGSLDFQDKICESHTQS